MGFAFTRRAVCLLVIPETEWDGRVCGETRRPDVSFTGRACHSDCADEDRGEEAVRAVEVGCTPEESSGVDED